ncbi:MAG: hypothetical protein K6E68_05030 [Lachnospiraceae bacterium]|jgi:hypothetical protein|nr:hypothetical protein [Lachnospiraceae bacterium]
MIDFETELKKFYPSLEMEDVEEALYKQDPTDMVDMVIEFIRGQKTEEKTEVKDKEEK